MPSKYNKLPLLYAHQHQQYFYKKKGKNTRNNKERKLKKKNDLKETYIPRRQRALTLVSCTTSSGSYNKKDMWARALPTTKTKRSCCWCTTQHHNMLYGLECVYRLYVNCVFVHLRCWNPYKQRESREIKVLWAHMSVKCKMIAPVSENRPLKKSTSGQRRDDRRGQHNATYKYD